MVLRLVEEAAEFLDRIVVAGRRPDPIVRPGGRLERRATMMAERRERWIGSESSEAVTLCIGGVDRSQREHDGGITDLSASLELPMPEAAVRLADVVQEAQRERGLDLCLAHCPPSAPLGPTGAVPERRMSCSSRPQGARTRRASGPRTRPSAEAAPRDVGRAARRRLSAEAKARAGSRACAGRGQGLRGRTAPPSPAGARGSPPRWSKRGPKTSSRWAERRPTGDTARAATSDEGRALRRATSRASWRPGSAPRCGPRTSRPRSSRPRPPRGSTGSPSRPRPGPGPGRSSGDGSSPIAGDPAERLEGRGMTHGRGAPRHPRTRGPDARPGREARTRGPDAGRRIGRRHRSPKSARRANGPPDRFATLLTPLEPHDRPGALEGPLGALVEPTDRVRPQESPNNLTPADIHRGPQRGDPGRARPDRAPDPERPAPAAPRASRPTSPPDGPHPPLPRRPAGPESPDEGRSAKPSPGGVGGRAVSVRSGRVGRAESAAATGAPCRRPVRPGFRLCARCRISDERHSHSDLAGPPVTGRTSVLHVRVDEDTKARAAEALAGSGLTRSDAVRVFLARVAQAGGLPPELAASGGAHDAWFRARGRLATPHRSRVRCRPGRPAPGPRRPRAGFLLRCYSGSRPGRERRRCAAARQGRRVLILARNRAWGFEGCPIPPSTRRREGSGR